MYCLALDWSSATRSKALDHTTGSAIASQSTLAEQRIASYICLRSAGSRSRRGKRRQYMASTPRIGPCLWFDDRAEEAARFYTGIFKKSKIRKISRYGEAGQDVHRRPPGSVMTVEFELDGQPFTALNGGPVFQFNEAISFVVTCKDQEEVDYYWDKLSEGGDPEAQQCGWLKDQYGVSWQVVPALLTEMVGDPNSDKSQRAMAAMMQMKKIDVATLERAFAA
jgi:predicted 3-demethylubiquinone-9 3-methyltransferase (glyoxalase superfamily)